MIKELPDKWIRKAISNDFNNIEVEGKIIPVYDSRVTGPNISEQYVLMSTQSNLVQKTNKCEDFWNSIILLDIVSMYDLPGNPGSRLLADNICNQLRSTLNTLELDAGSGLKIITSTMSTPNDLYFATKNQIVYRKFISLSLIIQ